MAQTLTPMAYVQAVMVAYRKYGRNPEAMLASAGLTRAEVRDANRRISAAQMETLSATAMKELDDEALGWFSRRLPWGSYGMLCRASLSAPSLRVALSRWCRHHGLLTRDVELQLEVGRTEARLRLTPKVELGTSQELCLLTLLRYVHGYACWLIDSQLALTEVTFPFSAPKHAKVYETLFPGPVRFGADDAGFSFDTRYLELRPARDELAMTRMLQNALPITARPYRRDRLLMERVRAALGEVSTARELAKALHVSERSIHRHLAEEGTSLQKLKDDVHRERAFELLARTDLPLKQLAVEVGYRNVKSFARAFRGWTGMSPTDYRTHRSPVPRER